MAKYVKTEEGYTSKYDIGLATKEDMISIESTIQATADLKMDKENPVATGSFSMGRKASSVIGKHSHAEGYSTTASGDYSHAEGYSTTASGNQSHAEGYSTTASGNQSHAEGYSTTASGNQSHAEGYSTTASASSSHAEGQRTIASGYDSHAEGFNTKTPGTRSHAEGCGTQANNLSQHVQGEYNIIDTTGTLGSRGTYAHIVGNGTRENDRSNAHTLDWNGIGWFQGGLQVGGNAQDDGAQTVMLNGDKEIILASSTEGSTKKFKITVDDSGTITSTEII